MGGGSTQCLPLEFYTSQVTSTKDDKVQRYASTMLVWHQNQRRLCFGVDIAHRGERVSLGLSANILIAQFHQSGDSRILSWCCAVSMSVGANKCAFDKEVMEVTVKPDSQTVTHLWSIIAPEILGPISTNSIC